MNLNFSKYYRLENHSCWSFMVLFWFSSRVTQIRVQLWSGGWEGLSKAVSPLHKLDWVPPRRWSIKSYLNSLSYIAVFGQEGHILAWGAVTPVTAGSVHRKKRSLNDGGGHESVFWKLMIFPPCFQAGRETPPLVCWFFFCPGQLHHYLYPVLLDQDAPSPHLFGQENCLQSFWLDCVCLSEPLDGSH